MSAATPATGICPNCRGTGRGKGTSVGCSHCLGTGVFAIAEVKAKLTHAEIVEIFGETMPIEAANLLVTPPADWTIDQVREKLKRIAAVSASQEAAAPSEDGKFGKFGHHPDPAIDFEVEIDELIGMAHNRRVGFDPEPTLEARVEQAMKFRVGGVESCIDAKDCLRKIDAELRPASPAVAPVAVGDAAEIVFGILWPQQEWNGEEGFCRAVAEKVVRTLSLSSIIPATKGGEDELHAISAAIGSVRFMDLPDGGDVSLAEQVSRMRQALKDAEAGVQAARPIIEALIAQEYNVETWGLRSRLAALSQGIDTEVKP